MSPNSNEVLKKISEEDLQTNFELFYKEMVILGATGNTLFILLGEDVKELFLHGPIFHYNNIVCCQHYAYYGIKTSEWIKNTQNKLRIHEERTNNIFGTNPFVAPS